MKFFRSESGAVSVEFVLVLPVMMAIFGLIGVTSHLYAVSSDIQQTSFELARRSVALAGTEPDPGSACRKLTERYSAQDIERIGVYLSAPKVRKISCTPVERNFLAVEVSYDVSSNPLAGLGRLVGLSVDTLSRRTVVGL